MYWAAQQIVGQTGARPYEWTTLVQPRALAAYDEASPEQAWPELHHGPVGRLGDQATQIRSDPVN